MPAFLNKLLFPGLAFLVILVVLLVVRALVLRGLHHWAKRTDHHLDDLIIGAFKVPSLFLCLALSLHLAIEFSELAIRYTQYVTKVIYLVVLLSTVLGATHLSSLLFRYYIRRYDLPVSAPGLAIGVINGLLWIIGFLIALTFLGVSIAPLLTALGVGGLAVSLALKDTLENIFAGINVLMEKSIRVGDFIRLESGQEGTVKDITWRTTRIQLLSNNTVIIPNSKLAQSVVTNYHLPEKSFALRLPVSASYASNPDRVEKVLLAEAQKALGEIPGLLRDPEPFVRFSPGFGESSLDFTLNCQVADYVDQYLVLHELRKRIFQRFRAEGIEIPFPQRTVHLRQSD
ncbi:MAG: mechanosensitive ion channel family protein [Desulfobacterota bacterium]|nr:mechanosensitive ion channel family protein [Thermodesulfobacteriota bacterium]